MKAVLIMGSESDMPHAEKITSALSNLGVAFEQHVASAHKNPEKVLEIIRSYTKGERVAFITIAGRSNALSVFMDNETRRILPEIPALAVPGLS